MRYVYAPLVCLLLNLSSLAHDSAVITPKDRSASSSSTPASVRNSQSLLIIDESQSHKEKTPNCKQCEVPTTQQDALCWKCNLKTKVKAIFPSIFKDRNTPSQKSDTPKATLNTSKNKKKIPQKRKDRGILYFLRHNVVWCKS